jgi:hypothetical protein
LHIVGVEVVSRISEGLMVLVGLGTGIESYLPCLAFSNILCLSIDDTPHDIDIITQKVYVAGFSIKQYRLVSFPWQVEYKGIPRCKFGPTLES